MRTTSYDASVFGSVHAAVALNVSVDDWNVAVGDVCDIQIERPFKINWMTFGIPWRLWRRRCTRPTTTILRKRWCCMLMLCSCCHGRAHVLATHMSSCR